MAVAEAYNKQRLFGLINRQRAARLNVVLPAPNQLPNSSDGYNLLFKDPSVQVIWPGPALSICSSMLNSHFEENTAGRVAGRRLLSHSPWSGADQ